MCTYLPRHPLLTAWDTTHWINFQCAYHIQKSTRKIQLINRTVDSPTKSSLEHMDGVANVVRICNN